MAAIVALAVSMALLAIVRLDKSTDGLSSYEGPYLQVHGTQYDELESYEQMHDQQVMGLYPQEFRLGLNDMSMDDDGNTIGNSFTYRFAGEDGGEHFAAAYLESPVEIVLVGSRGDAIDYRISPKPAKKWSVAATIPKRRDLKNPVGTWSLSVESSSQSWAHTTWLTIREDGTGEFGSIDKGVNSATTAELAKATRPCTVTYEQIPNGTKIVAHYEGGTYVLTVTEGQS